MTIAFSLSATIMIMKAMILNMQCYMVYLNGKLLDTVHATKQAAVDYVSKFDLNGTWSLVNKVDLHYQTSKGQIYTFMLSEVSK